jgi:ankyrin repeat protein
MVDPKLNPKMMEALNAGNLDLVSEALDEGADPNLILDDGNPLFVAIAFNGDLEFVKLFLSKGVNINNKF